MRNGSKRLRMAVGGGMWLLVISAGMGWWMLYDRTPGAAAAAGNAWPGDSSLVLNDQAGTAIVFVHPHCPCTRATLEKLDSALASCTHKPNLYVFVSPVDLDAKKTEAGDNYRRAAAISGAICIVDSDRTAQAHFGAATSGQVIYFDARGNLKFAGGLTAERGGVAPGGAERQFAAALRGEAQSPVKTPVFGCPL